MSYLELWRDILERKEVAITLYDGFVKESGIARLEMGRALVVLYDEEGQEVGKTDNASDFAALAHRLLVGRDV